MRYTAMMPLLIGLVCPIFHAPAQATRLSSLPKEGDRYAAVPESYKKRFGTGESGAEAADAVLRNAGSSRADKLAALDALTYMGYTGSGYLSDFGLAHYKEPEWGVPIAEAMAKCVSGLNMPALLRLVYINKDPAVKLKALETLTIYVKAPTYLFPDRSNRDEAVLYEGDPLPPIRYMASRRFHPEHRDDIESTLLPMVYSETHAPEVKKAAENLLKLMKERDKREAEFLKMVRSSMPQAPKEAAPTP